MAKEQQQRANQIGAYADQEAAPAFVGVRSAGNFRQKVDGIPLSSISSVPECFGERKIMLKHSKSQIARVRLTSADPALPVTTGNPGELSRSTEKTGRNPNLPSLPS
jgi:hypothetical protein